MTSILERRRIEAEFAKAIYDAMAAEIGREKARRILSDAVITLARATGAQFRAKEQGPTGLESFAALLPLWQADDALEIEYLEKGEKRLAFNVTRCRYSEMYKAMGVGELGDALSCNRDGEFCTGYDPRIKLTRTQTIMKGAPHCDFRYEIEDEPKKA
ncbi:MAG: L-2-amino-thiazoline-4-carboxylic acid hydrolase [Alphaproteobacteria bacterium]